LDRHEGNVVWEEGSGEVEGICREYRLEGNGLEERNVEGRGEEEG